MRRNWVWPLGRARRISSVQTHLVPGEEVVAAFSTLTHSPMWVTMSSVFLTQTAFGIYDLSHWPRVLLGALFLMILVGYFFVNKNYVVVATDMRTIVGRADRLFASKLLEVEVILPPNVRIGPGRGIFWHKTDVLGPRVRYSTFFDNEVRAADSRSLIRSQP